MAIKHKLAPLLGSSTVRASYTVAIVPYKIGGDTSLLSDWALVTRSQASDLEGSLPRVLLQIGELKFQS